MFRVKIAFAIIALGCFAQSYPNPSVLDVSGLKKALTVYSPTSVKDSQLKEVMFVNVTLGVWGDFNQTSDQQSITDLVRDKLHAVQDQPEDAPLDLNTGYPLPLQYNLTVKEALVLGPQPKKTIIVHLNVLVYAKSHHHHEALTMLNSVDPSF